MADNYRNTYRTRMCPTIKMNGFCPYDDVCRFAHARHELRRPFGPPQHEPHHHLGHLVPPFNQEPHYSPWHAPGVHELQGLFSPPQHGLHPHLGHPVPFGQEPRYPPWHVPQAWQYQRAPNYERAYNHPRYFNVPQYGQQAPFLYHHEANGPRGYAHQQGQLQQEPPAVPHQALPRGLYAEQFRPQGPMGFPHHGANEPQLQGAEQELPLHIEGLPPSVAEGLEQAYRQGILRHPSREPELFKIKGRD